MIIQIEDKNYEAFDATELVRIAVRKEFMPEVSKKNLGKNFIENIDKLAQDITNLPLNYKNPIHFSFLVVPTGKEFSGIVKLPVEKGMCEAPIALDKQYPLTLCVDENWFIQGFDNINISSRVGLTHELAHIIHGGYFRNLGQISEGFAELLPHYLMNFEAQNINHKKALASFDEKDMQTMAFVNQNGMFAKENIDGRNTQQRQSYMSVYLWMLGYVKRVENIYNADKFAATNMLLERFSQIDNQTWKDKIKAVADMVKIPQQEMMCGLSLQKEGMHYLIHEYNILQFNHILQNSNSR